MSEDLRHAWKLVVRTPWLHLALAAILGVGIGGSAAMYGLVSRTLLNPLPYPHPERIVRVLGAGINPEHGGIRWWSQGGAFSALALYQPGTVAISGGRGGSRYVAAADVTAGFFGVFDTAPRLGRDFLPSEYMGDALRVVLSDALWRQDFAADRGIVGRGIELNGRPARVVGVMPPGFGFPGHTEVWLADTSGRGRSAQLGANHQKDIPAYGGNIGRLRAGVTLAQAQAQITVLWERLKALPRPKTEGIGDRPAVVRAQDEMVRGYRDSLVMLAAAVGLVLLIACADVGGILLARAAMRRQEMAIRASLGATRVRLLRQLLCEAVLLASGGAVLGLLFLWSLTAAVRSLGPANIPGLRELHVSGAVLGIMLLVALAAGVLASLVPLVAAARAQLLTGLQAAGTQSLGGVRQRLRSALVVLQMALGLILLLGAGLAIQRLTQLSTAPPGFETKGVISMSVHLPLAPPNAQPRSARVAKAVQSKELAARLSAALAWQRRMEAEAVSLPGMQAVGFTTNLPLTQRGSEYWFQMLGPGRDPRCPGCWTRFAMIAGQYFRVMRIPLLAGRYFGVADGPLAPRVLVVSHEFARRYYGSDTGALGEKVRVGGADQLQRIVGVVGGVATVALGEERFPELYFPYAQTPRGQAALDLSLVARTGGSEHAALSSLAQRLHQDGLPVYDARTLREVEFASVASPRFRMLLLSVFALVALGLALAGVYGLMSYLVARRTAEMGVRMALGAGPGRVRRMVLGQGLGLALWGTVIGLAGAYVLQRWASAAEAGLPPLSLPAAAAAAVLLLLAAAAACWLPARRAARIAPAAALRNE